jgi:hypothetical protein
MCAETMCVVWDAVTETIIGPFNSHEDAQMFVLHASDILLDGNVSELTIEPVSDPQDWALDNAYDGSLFSTQEAN